MDNHRRVPFRRYAGELGWVRVIRNMAEGTGVTGNMKEILNLTS